MKRWRPTDYIALVIAVSSLLTAAATILEKLGLEEKLKVKTERIEKQDALISSVLE